MFPMEFDHRILATLPLPDEVRVAGVVEFLRAIVARRIAPYFRNKRGTDAFRLGRLTEKLSIVRMEDENNRIRTVSVVTGDESGWFLRIHERIFDYLSFVIPADPEATLGEGSREEHKMLAFTEFFLRHEAEHVLYPERTEREVILADVSFALDRRSGDPTFYRMLRYALSDEMNGLKGEQFLALLDEAERGLSLEERITSILNAFGGALEEAPEEFLLEIFPEMDAELRNRVLGEIYRKSRDTSRSLLKRSRSFRLVLRLFSLLVKRSETEARKAFLAFKDRWGLVDLFKELDLPEATVDARDPQELLKRFLTGLYAHLEEEPETTEFRPHQPTPSPPAQPREAGQKTLKDRIEEARANPAIPRDVVDVIEQNRLNAVGHSGSKYIELIETLLAIPWGKIKRIQVTPRAFEEGLNRTHHGLQVPKEIICDFFTNLIWRYRQLKDTETGSWKGTGSAFLLVGPPGVGKTSFAISIAQNLGIPYHKISLGGMRDEADIRGHGFTYEGSKPGAIVQGLIKMQAMNGLFILDEADKTEKFAIATLLEILDPEQNHLFHDKYTETTVDIDLSNCHFFLTANTLEAVPHVVANRCEVITLDQYSVEEKVAIARDHLIARLRRKYQIPPEEIHFDPQVEADLLRYLIRTYTFEAGVRELERVIRTLFLRMQRARILGETTEVVRITREKIKHVLKEPSRPRQINPEDALGEMLALGVDVDKGIGSIIPIQATRMGTISIAGEGRRGFLSIVHATGNIERVMDESRKVATTGIFTCAERLGIASRGVGEPVHLHFMGGSTRKDGPSAGGSIAIALVSLLSDHKVRRDVAMTGEIDTKGRITAVGALGLKIETACSTGCRTLIIPKENLQGEGSIERLPRSLQEELQVLPYEEWTGPHKPFDFTRHILEVVAVEDIVQAAHIALLDESELDALENAFEPHAREKTDLLGYASPRTTAGIQVVQVKTPEEVDRPFAELMAKDACCRLHLFIVPGIRDAVLQRLGDLGDRLHIVDFDPGKQRLRDALADQVGAFRPSENLPFRLSVIAPYYLLRRDGIQSGDFPPNGSFLGLTLFANNFAEQGVKIKQCKRTLNHVFSVLTHLPEDDLLACPFLGRVDDIHVADLSYIPEKYRLDIHRAERILNGSLARWLRVVGRGGEGD
ncbi:MAG: AAA family ATPase [Deltaproteobacteria bacterium]|nr:AAA family ATPase [Deltaproteobacteria bacterium]